MGSGESANTAASATNNNNNLTTGTPLSTALASLTRSS